MIPRVDAYLPTSVKEMKILGWDSVDVVLFSGDAYVDHPSFGAAVIGRTLQAAGYRVAIVPQPNWQDDLRDFRKFGAPRLFFGVSAGAMDSMVNHYTAARRRRSDDAYTVIAGGIEASMRRLSHYDYWEDRLRPSLLIDCGADLISYGMGEKCVVEIARHIDSGESLDSLTCLPQTVIRTSAPGMDCREGKIYVGEQDIVLHSYERCQADKRCQAENFRAIRCTERLCGSVTATYG